MSHANPKKLLKNTLHLYFRLCLTLGVTLYTSRVIIGALGITDYGIFNVVAGSVTMMAFLNSAMATGTQRFLSFEIGNNQSDNLNKIFNTALVIHAAIALTVFIIAQILGPTLLNHFLTIPTDRLSAAHWVLQCMIFGTIAGVIQVPYIAVIIARERMQIYAYMSLLDVALKLAIVFLVKADTVDRLKLYSALYLAASVVIVGTYAIYCGKVFPECRITCRADKKKLREMSSFVGWNISANLASVIATQGVNMLLNVFFGPAINAARGIAIQASGSIQSFVSSFQIASAPQIIKTYSAGQFEEEKKLIFFSCKITFVLLFLIAAPIFLESHFLLDLWLLNPPPEAGLFLKIILVDALINTSANPFFQAILATGDIKHYQMICSAIVIGGVGLSWILLSQGAFPHIVFLVAILVSLLLLWRRLNFLYRKIDLRPSDYWRTVISPGIRVGTTAIIIPLIIHNSLEESIIRVLLVGFATAAVTIPAVFLFALTDEEALFIKSRLRKRILGI